MFNSSVSYQEHKLIDHWLKDLDLLNSLFGVLLSRSPCTADISIMYRGVVIHKEQDVHRFLWRNRREVGRLSTDSKDNNEDSYRYDKNHKEKQLCS